MRRSTANTTLFIDSSTIISMILYTTLCLYLLSFNFSQISAADRQRGNIVRNDLDRVNNTHNYTITAIRSESKYEGRKLGLTVATEGFPFFRVSRLNPMPDSLMYDPKYIGGKKMSFRIGLFSLIEYRESPDGVEGLDRKDEIISRFPLWGRNSSTFFPAKETTGTSDDIRYYSYEMDSIKQSLSFKQQLNNNGQSGEDTEGDKKRDRNRIYHSVESHPNANGNSYIRSIGQRQITNNNDTSDDIEPLVSIRAATSDLRGWVTDLNMTVAPSAWKFLLIVRGYEYSKNYTDTRLAVKALIELDSSDGLVAFRDNIPEIQRDDPFEQLGEVVVRFDSTLQLNDTSPEDKMDRGYFSWEKVVTCYGGTPAPWVDAEVDPRTGERGNVPVLDTGLLARGRDIDREVEQIPLEILEDTELGRDPEEDRYYIYFSFPINQPEVLIWDPFVGIDEMDAPVEDKPSSVSRLYISIYLVALLLSTLVLL